MGRALATIEYPGLNGYPIYVRKKAFNGICRKAHVVSIEATEGDEVRIEYTSKFGTKGVMTLKNLKPELSKKKQGSAGGVSDGRGTKRQSVTTRTAG